VDGVLLAFGDGDLDGVIIRRRPDPDILQRRAERSEHGAGSVESGPHLGRDDNIVFVQMPHDPDP